MDPSSVFSDLPILETPRLLLRKVSLDDAQDMFEYLSDPEVTKQIAANTHQTIEDSKQQLMLEIESYGKWQGANWSLVHKGEGKMIGMCGMMVHSTQSGRAEIGYSLSRRYWGQGPMTEAVRAVISFCFGTLGLNRIEALCWPENVASSRVVEKAGMSLEGLLREYTFAKGAHRDLKIYSILRREWVNSEP